MILTTLGTLGTSISDLRKGVLNSRQVMLEVAQKGLPIATELLNPLLAPFFQDLVSVGVIGARTTESQPHREMTSDMPMPIGIKNGTDGGLKVAIDAMTAASRSHTVVGTDDEGRLEYHLSQGNLDTFMILRGGSDGPNFGPEHIQDAAKAMLNAGKKPPSYHPTFETVTLPGLRNNISTQWFVAICLKVGNCVDVE